MGPVSVTNGQDLQDRKVWYQKVRFMSEGWYPIFFDPRSGTKKCEKTLRMVNLVATSEDPDQIEHLRRVERAHFAHVSR